MKTTETIEFIRDPSHFIRIEAIEEFDDGSGFVGQLYLQSGAFACMGHQYYFDSLKRFAEDIEAMSKSLKGSAVIRSEHKLEFIRFSAALRGHITVSGEIREFTGSGQCLKFTFPTDQSFLPPLLKSVMSAMKSFE